VIPHGEYGLFASDPQMTRAKAREQLGLDPGKTWYLFFGHIDEYKGLDVALKALARSSRDSDEGGQAGLIIAGNPGKDVFTAYAGIIEELGLGDRISLNLGHIPVDDIQLYFRAADVLLLPYRESSTSGLVHIAMGFGMPVIASDVGGLRVLVEESGAGIIVKPGDEAGLAAAMAELGGDDEKRRQLGKAWDDVEAKYSWDNIAIKTIAVYQSLLDR
jgi:glycosyltransferase involved in cell wall biosynthesis